ncbi:MAG: AarF/UbiB family protein [Planctomycetes bacterium]|jgi:ubiquinone biosynthesis protein|nr:AarF/UbiB family protein [Planctomycetota bacterium]
MSILSIARTYGHLRRMRRIVQVLSRYGFGYVVLRMNLGRVPLVGRLGRVTDLPENLTPVQDLAFRTRKVLEDLGTTFVKLGQILSYRPDLLPEEFIEQFRGLQDRVKPFETAKAKETVREAVGKELGEVFSRFDEVPVGAGSIGQVHRAALADGTEVIVKVKRPGIDAEIRADVGLLSALARMSEHYLPEIRVARPVMLVEEFEHQMEKETDFRIEAANTAQFLKVRDRLPGIRIPRVFWEYTNRDVLVVERLDGAPLGDLARLEALGLDRGALARRLADAFLTQFFEIGLFHADPHAGNLLVGGDGTIGLVDFGLVGHLSEEVRGHLGTLILGGIRRDPEIILEVYREMGVVSEDSSSRDLKHDIVDMLDKYLGLPLGQIDTLALFQDIVRLGRKYQAVLPRDFVLLGKSMVTVSDVLKTLDRRFNVLETAAPHARTLLAERLSPRRLLQSGLGTGWAFAGLLRRLPGDVTSVLRRLRAGEFRLNVRHEGIERMTEEMERSSNRVALSVILASMAVGSALLTVAKVGPTVLGDLPVLGGAGILASLLCGVLIVLSILRSGRI